MFKCLATHPFGVEASFEYALVITIAVPKEQLRSLVPSFLDLDVADNKWAFLAIATVQTKNLRPKGFPKIVGRNFFLIGYRIFVRYTNKKGKKRRGLYILKSQTDAKLMQLLGRVFTQYRYEVININQQRTAQQLHIATESFETTVNLSESPFPLPLTSPFNSWEEARRFSGPLPFTFSHISKGILIIEGVRTNWQPQPVKIEHFRSDFLTLPAFKNARLASAFMVKNIPYYWKKGFID